MKNEDQNMELNGADIFADWDKLVSEQSNIQKNELDILAVDNLMTDGGEAYWLDLFRKTNLSGMDLVALKPIANYVSNFKMEQDEFKRQMHLFLMNLSGEHLNDLRIAGLSDDQIENLSKGILPINWTVHLKHPVAYGGTITLDHLVLMPEQPFHEELHAFLNRQLLSDAGPIRPPVLYVPTPKTSVYIPFYSNEMPSEVIDVNRAGSSS